MPHTVPIQSGVSAPARRGNRRNSRGQPPGPPHTRVSLRPPQSLIREGPDTPGPAQPKYERTAARRHAQDQEWVERRRRMDRLLAILLCSTPRVRRRHLRVNRVVVIRDRRRRRHQRRRCLASSARSASRPHLRGYKGLMGRIRGEHWTAPHRPASEVPPGCPLALSYIIRPARRVSSYNFTDCTRQERTVGLGLRADRC
jgi:hypothetical protein